MKYSLIGFRYFFTFMTRIKNAQFRLEIAHTYHMTSMTAQCLKSKYIGSVILTAG